MDDYHILITGDFAHRDFTDLLRETSNTKTLMELDSISRRTHETKSYDLIVVAQSYPGQFENQVIEQLIESAISIPVVLLCGSWCEGEQRSGNPVSGAIRIYWHQWLGRSENFFDRINHGTMTSWHLPRIASDVDHLLVESEKTSCELTERIGISSQLQENFDMLRSGLSNSQPIWIESLDSGQIANTQFSVICVDALSLTDHTQQRIQRLLEQFPTSNVVLCLNFPRPKEIRKAKRLGVSEIVSKPFRLSDLRIAIQRATREKAA